MQLCGLWGLRAAESCGWIRSKSTFGCSDADTPLIPSVTQHTI